MSNERGETVSYAIIIPHIAPARPAPPHRIPSQWILFVANRDELIQKETDKRTFDSVHCGQKISFKRYQ